MDIASILLSCLFQFTAVVVILNDPRLVAVILAENPRGDIFTFIKAVATCFIQHRWSVPSYLYKYLLPDSRYESVPVRMLLYSVFLK
ncbi:hypothetical protein F5Y06DRAFT_21998 [Hypoxylon sp. FL0890]|nr:hypothetical protein F5Y06DRAFT_21998 [Hypoxylon sp. FL0890]